MMPSERRPATWRISSGQGSSAIAVLEVTGDVDRVCTRLGLGPMPVGSVRVRRIGDIDEAVVVRWSDRHLQIMPHGGPVVLRRIGESLTRSGAAARGEDALADYPEAATEVEARMLSVLARAASPRAVDLLLDQPARWARSDAHDAGLDRMLNRLIEPPVVAAVGPANVGKSTLVNALAGRSVAIVADEPGTTRDHVGVLLELDGLAVRWVDTPGDRGTGPWARACEASQPGSAGPVLDPPPPDLPQSVFQQETADAEAACLARRVVGQADLVVSCGDAAAPPIQLDHPAILTVALRADLGPTSWGADALVSALRNEGLIGLARLVRRRLVPDQALTDPRPWRFW